MGTSADITLLLPNSLTFYSSISFGLPLIHLQTLSLLCYLQLSSLVGTFSLIHSYSLVGVSDLLLFIADWDSLLLKSI